MAIFQSDTAISERNNALIERDNAISSLEYSRDNCMNGERHHLPLPSSSPQSSASPYNHGREMNSNESAEMVGLRKQTTKCKAKAVPSKNSSKPQRRKKKKGGHGEDLNGESPALLQMGKRRVAVGLLHHDPVHVPATRNAEQAPCPNRGPQDERRCLHEVAQPSGIGGS